MDKKNPLLAGLLNMLVPGAGYLYIENDRGRFFKTLIISVVAIAALLWLGNLIQSSPGFSLPQGLCIGTLLLFVLVPLFRLGLSAANRHNMVADSAALYNARQKGTDQAQLDRNQELRDKGLISVQEFDSRKDNLDSKK